MRSVCLIEADGTIEVDNDLVLPIYSITKTLIAYTIFRLNVSIEDSIHKWISTEWCPHDINIGQLLNHSSGLTDYGALPEYQDAIQSGAVWSDAHFAEHTLQKPLLFEPGTQFAYSNPGYWLLKRVIETETGETLSRALSEYVFEPFQMSSAYVAKAQFAEDLPNYPAEWVWHGLVMANAKDIARFLHNADVSLLHNNLIQVTDAGSPWQNPHYGNGLMIEPDQWYGHNGGGPGYSASAFHFDKLGITGCVLSPEEHDPENPDPAMQALFSRVSAIHQ